jgi:hypothetical protein
VISLQEGLVQQELEHSRVVLVAVAQDFVATVAPHQVLMVVLGETVAVEAVPLVLALMAQVATA